MAESALFIALTTLSSSNRATEMAEGAVSDGLAACAQVEGPVHSHYRWNGSLNCDKEWRVVFKTTSEKLIQLEAYVRSIHTYSTPQWVAWQVDVASAAYAEWVRSSTNLGQ